MKSKLLKIFILTALFISAASYAQVDRSVAPNQYRQPRIKGDKKKKMDLVEQTAEFYRKEFTLDDFQFAAVREILESERGNIVNLMENREMTSDERREKAYAVNARIDSKILPMLSAEQIEKYKKFQEKRNKI